MSDYYAGNYRTELTTIDKVGAIALIVFVMVGVMAGYRLHVLGVLDHNTKAHCLECGYSHHVTYRARGYCIRLEDGSEIVRPVEEACQK